MAWLQRAVMIPNWIYSTLTYNSSIHFTFPCYIRLLGSSFRLAIAGNPLPHSSRTVSVSQLQRFWQHRCLRNFQITAAHDNSCSRFNNDCTM
jgi:hypothetical protein